MALNWPTFFTRLGSAIVFCIIMMAGLLWNLWAFAALAALIQYLCLREFFRLVKKIYPDTTWPAWMPVLVQCFAFALLLLLTVPMPEGSLKAWPALLFVPVLMLLCGTLSKKTALQAAIQSFGGLLYIALPISLLFLLREKSIMLPLSLILMIWMNDTMAYLVGSFIGKTPFSPISPKKTWEGTAGGAILTIAGAAVWGSYTHYYHMTDWMALALCAALAGTAGDLLESKLKRMADVKDSGTMMPGHGGALDRFDSLLVATPFAFAYAYLFMPAVPLTIF
ncbi:phosphatidate cytidylyltransferase [Chitinophagaceae bacterium MMS25-I14]